MSRKVRKLTVVVGVLAAAGLVVSACSSSSAKTGGGQGTAAATSSGSAQSGSSGSGKIPKEETFNPSAAIMEKAYGTTSTSGVPQVDLASLVRAEKAVDPQTLSLAIKCFKDNKCDTGHGTLTVALADGFGENAWRQVTNMEFILQALTYPQIKTIIYTDARGDTSQAISNMRSLIAQHVDIITGFMDAGAAMLPTIKEATQQGILVIPYTTAVGGTPGIDYTGFVGEDLCVLGKDFGKLVNDNLNGKGNLVLLGGTPGNPLTASIQACEKPALDPGIKILGSASTNWTQAGTLTAMSGFLSENKPINAITYEYADGFMGGVRAYQAAHRPLNVLLALRTDENDLMCEWKKIGNPNFVIYYGQGGSFQSRIALTAAMMKLEGYSVPGNVVVPFSLNKVDANTCNPKLPATAPISTLVPQNVLDAMFPG